MSAETAHSQSEHNTAAPMLDIPTQPETWASFRKRLDTLLASPQTHAYVDTSFLMWLTKIGSTSRNELFEWLKRTLPERVHVPIWAAHEYIKHHTQQTPANDFRKTHRRVSALVRNAYGDLRPYFDDPLGNGAENPSALRVSMRETLNRLRQLLDVAANWPKQHYERHSTEVLQFINSAATSNTSLYSDFSAIADHADVRLTSHVPPGFKDQHKQANQYGDLLFWTETLQHAHQEGASGILVITNDVKNDWRFGGATNTAMSDPDLSKRRTSWDPIPRPHPMLLVEARLRTNIDAVELLDSVYLGMYLNHIDDPNIAKFADVALVPDVATRQSPQTDQHHPGDGAIDDAADPSATASTSAVLFDDPPQVKATRPKLAKALHLSRQPLENHLEEILSTWATQSTSRSSPDELFHSEAFNALDHRELISLARTLHDHARDGMPAFPVTIADVISVIQRLPNNTAACIYLGFLASMYLSRDLNEALLPPTSPIAQQLFRLQNQEFAPNPVFVISRHLVDAEFCPVYIPSSEPADVQLTLDTNPHGSLPSELASLRFRHTQTQYMELLTPVQADSSLRIAELFGSQEQIKGSSIIQKACELFVLPEHQVFDHPSIENDYSATASLGFKNPSRVRIPTEQTNGN